MQAKFVYSFVLWFRSKVSLIVTEKYKFDHTHDTLTGKFHLNWTAIAIH